MSKYRSFQVRPDQVGLSGANDSVINWRPRVNDKDGSKRDLGSEAEQIRRIEAAADKQLRKRARRKSNG